MMNDLLKFIKEIKDKTNADAVVLGSDEDGGYILAIMLDGFEQVNRMPLDTKNTIDSIVGSFLWSYGDYLEDLRNER
tara:strand:- start:295 stop:525 length:231 start_codon:yes stop_codon:yes gene_type:complete